MTTPLDFLTSPPALLAVSLGALALGPLVYRLTQGHHGARGVLDGFVFTAIGALVLLEIFPHSIAAIGPIALLAGLCGLAIPFALERSDALSKRANALVVGLAVLGLLVHETLDGVALSAAGQGADAMALALAVVLHRLPVAVAIWWMARPVLGPRLTALALLVMGSCTSAGFAFGGAALAGLEEGGLALFQALMAGSLLHVLLHRPQDAPKGDSETRWHPLEAAGATAGLALFLALAHEEGPASALAEPNLAQRLLDLALACAPTLAISYVVAGLLGAWLTRTSVARLGDASRLRGTLRAATLGLALPTCSCDLAPAYRDLLDQGVRPSTSLAFLTATSQLGVVSLALSLPLLGLPLTGLRILAAGAVALLVGVITGRLSAPRVATEVSPAQAESHWEGFRTSILDVVDDTAPWIVLGLVALACVDPGAAASALEQVPGFLAVGGAAVAGSLFYLAAPGATAAAAGLLAVGGSPGAGLALLVTGPLLHWAALRLVRTHHGTPAAAAFGAVILGLAVALGALVDAAVPRASLAPPDLSGWRWGVASWVALGLISLAFAVSVVRQGPRAFVHTLLPTTLRLHEHQHHHAHEHGPGGEHDEGHGPDRPRGSPQLVAAAHHHEHGHGEHGHDNAHAHGHEQGRHPGDPAA